MLGPGFEELLYQRTLAKGPPATISHLGGKLVSVFMPSVHQWFKNMRDKESHGE